MYQCQTCCDNEVILVRNEDGKEVARDCHCKKKRLQDRLLKSSRISEEFSKRTFSEFDLKVDQSVIDAYECAYQYAAKFKTIRNDPRNGLALIGQPGSGKTHLIMAVANHLLKKQINVLYFQWVDGMNELKDDLSNLDERIKQLQQADVLFIDDIFKPPSDPTKFELKQLFAIINHRYLEKLPIMISSELTFSEMCKYDEATASRMKQMCNDFRVVIKKDISNNYRMRDE